MKIMSALLLKIVKDIFILPTSSFHRMVPLCIFRMYKYKSTSGAEIEVTFKQCLTKVKATLMS